MKQPSLPNVPFLTGLKSVPVASVETEAEGDAKVRLIIEKLWDAGRDTLDISDVVLALGDEPWRIKWTEARVSWHVDNYVRRKAAQRLT